MPSRSAKMNKTPAARSAKGAAVLKAREKSGKTQRSKRSRDRTKATGRQLKRSTDAPKAARKKKTSRRGRKPLA
jgi:hypothetical protein